MNERIRDTAITRREFVVAIGAGTLAPTRSFAQRPAKVRRIGLLSLVAKISYANAGRLSMLVQSLREHGYTEGRDYVFDGRYADGDAARLPALAAELVRAGVDVIVLPGTQLTLALQKVTSTIPIMELSDADPVANGFAVSLARLGYPNVVAGVMRSG